MILDLYDGKSVWCWSLKLFRDYPNLTVGEQEELRGLPAAAVAKNKTK